MCSFTVLAVVLLMLTEDALLHEAVGGQVLCALANAVSRVSRSTDHESILFHNSDEVEYRVNTIIIHVAM